MIGEVDVDRFRDFIDRTFHLWSVKTCTYVGRVRTSTQYITMGVTSRPERSDEIAVRERSIFLMTEKTDREDGPYQLAEA